MNWIYNDEEIESHDDLHPDCTDFVYEITYTDGTKYIGKKTCRSIRRLKPTKKQLAIRKNYVRKELKNLPFIDYCGSSEETKGKEITCKEILYQCSTKKTASYLEVHLLFINNVLFTDEYLNKNISGTYWDNSLEGLIEGYKHD